MTPIPATSGIYRITCTTTGMFYIGSAVNLQRRRHYHFSELQRNIHKNPKMQHAFSKYGKDSFTFEVLEFVLIPEMLTAREQYWFAKLKPFGKNGFNICPTAGSNLGKKASSATLEKLRGKVPSAETRARISAANRGRIVSEATRTRIGTANRGRQLSVEQRRNLSEVNTGKKQSAETIRKRTQGQVGKKRDPEIGKKISQVKLGHSVSPETREKLRIANLGSTHALGHTVSPEARAVMRQKKLGKKLSEEHKRNVAQAQTGMKRSPEARENMRRAAQAREAKRRQAKLDAS